MELRGNIFKYYVYRMMCRALFFIPIFAIFLLDNGLSLMQIMVLEGIYAFMIIMLQIPGGAFADVFGRNRSIQLSTIFLFLGCFVMASSSTFWHFVLAEVIWAFATVLFSGAGNAFLYDTLKGLREEGLYKKVLGRSWSLELMASAGAFFLGGFLADISLRLPIYLALVPIGIAFLASLTFVEPRKTGKFSFKTYLRTMRESIAHIRGNRRLLFLIVYLAVVGVFSLLLFWFTQPYMQFIGIDIAAFGVIFASFTLFAAIVSFYAHRIEELIGETASLYLLPIFIGACLILMSFVSSIFGFAIIYLQEFVYGFTTPVATDYINKLSPSRMRATILSTINLVQEGMAIAVLPFFGYIADVYSLQNALLLSGLTLIMVCTVLIVIFHAAKEP